MTVCGLLLMSQTFLLSYTLAAHVTEIFTITFFTCLQAYLLSHSLYAHVTDIFYCHILNMLMSRTYFTITFFACLCQRHIYYHILYMLISEAYLLSHSLCSCHRLILLSHFYCVMLQTCLQAPHTFV